MNNIVLLDKSHNRQDFDCSVAALNQYLQQQAGQKQRFHQAKTYVLAENQTIIGYFTLSHTRFDWHENVSPKYKTVNTTALIARLAVDKRFAGQGMGAYLLRVALEKLAQANEITAIPIIAVDAKDGASAFYEQFGFQRLDNQGNRLFLLMETVLKLSE